MKHVWMASLSLLVASPVFAEEQPQGAPDMSKMGPWTRKPKNEKAVKKEIADFFKKEDELMKKKDMNGALANVDFPVFMVTDHPETGAPKADAWAKERYVQEMKPFWENMPADMKVTHKQTVTVLSDTLAAVADDFTMTMGKQKMSGRNAGFLIKVDGQWKWKMMAEAGWGADNAPPAQPAQPTAVKKVN
jgi:hypothetical protein